MLVLRKRIPERNMARFYCLSLEASLFGDTLLIARWGRIGTYGRRRAIIFGDLSSAREALEVQARSKVRRGYSVMGAVSI